MLGVVHYKVSTDQQFKALLFTVTGLVEVDEKRCPGESCMEDP